MTIGTQAKRKASFDGVLEEVAAEDGVRQEPADGAGDDRGDEDEADDLLIGMSSVVHRLDDVGVLDVSSCPRGTR